MSKVLGIQPRRIIREIRGPIRMEPVFMVLSQSAAIAAAMAIDDNVSVQQLDYNKLEERLLAQNQIFQWPLN